MTTNANTPRASNNAHASMDNTERSDMVPTLWRRNDRLKYQHSLSVDSRLGLLAGVKQNTAHQLLYGEAGIRARALLAVQTFRLCGKNPREYFSPLLAALDENPEASLARKIEADARENIAMAHWLENGSPHVRRDFVLALERQAAEALALAAKLRSDEEDEQ